VGGQLKASNFEPVKGYKWSQLMVDWKLRSPCSYTGIASANVSIQ